MSGRKVGRACTAKGCLNKSCSGKHQAFRFPREIERARLWAIKCNNKELVKQLDKVCSDHFESLFPALEGSSKKVPIAKENNKVVKGILFGSSCSSPGNDSEIHPNFVDKLQIKSEPHENINMEIKQEDSEDFPEYINIADVKNEIVDHKIEQEKVLIKNEPEDSNEQFHIGDVKTEIVDHSIEEEELLIKDEHEITSNDQLKINSKPRITKNGRIIETVLHELNRMSMKFNAGDCNKTDATNQKCTYTQCSSSLDKIFDEEVCNNVTN